VKFSPNKNLNLRDLAFQKMLELNFMENGCKLIEEFVKRIKTRRTKILLKYRKMKSPHLSMANCIPNPSS